MPSVAANESETKNSHRSNSTVTEAFENTRFHFNALFSYVFSSE